jgi:aminopeptidase N
MGGVPSLTMPEAQARAALLAVDSYQLDIDLTSGPETFCSTTTIRFTCAAPGADSFVEIRPRRLVSASLNGADLGLSTSSGGRVRLPGLRDANLLVVEAEFPYSHASEGMHRFADPAHGQVYVYAQPSIAQAPGFMACFDQPDLKASVTLRVRADPGWTVRANGPGAMTGPGRWAFAAGGERPAGVGVAGAPA